MAFDSAEFGQQLRDRGASLTGFADLTPLPEEARRGLPRGVSIAVALDADVVALIPGGPNAAYRDEKDRVNDLLDEIAEWAGARLKSAGHEAIALTRAAAGYADAPLATPLPYKTVATRAGLGWVGKCALVVTDAYGAAVRLTAVLTDAPLPLATAVDESRCGQCTACVEACPGGAVRGANWRPGIAREELFDAFQCRETVRRREEEWGVPEVGCGMCIAVCPHTRAYLARSGAAPSPAAPGAASSGEPAGASGGSAEGPAR